MDGKIDRRVGDADLLSGEFAWGRSPYANANCFPNPLDPCTVGPGVGGPRLIEFFSPNAVDFGAARSTSM